MEIQHGYFSEVQNYKTYEGSDEDFHFDYNANSGGGQAFLGGSFKLNGEKTSSQNLDGSTAEFALQYTDTEGTFRLISLGGREGVTFPIKPRGKDSKSVKLAVEGKPNPSRLMSVALLLPEPCGVGKSIAKEHSPLAYKNYWVRSMWLNIEQLSSNDFRFIVRDIVMSGKKFLKEQEKSTRFFKLDVQSRIDDLLGLNIDQFDISDVAREALVKYQKFFSGDVPFDFEALSVARMELLQGLAQRYPSDFSGSIDPLPFMKKIAESSGNIEIVRASQVDTLSRNLIYCGAPGVGKSRELSRLAKSHFTRENVRRITFYPDYGYSQFFGSYKPVTVQVGNSDAVRSEIQYQFVPGPLFESILKSLATPDQDFLLIIEEINRSNPASVFGDVFQLLDRSPSQDSTYSIQVSPEALECAKSNFAVGAGSKLLDDLLLHSELRLPSNLYLWATMNSADQGVFPMDTAFRRRWEFQYLNVDQKEEDILEYVVELGVEGIKVRWNDLRKAINQRLIDLRINEDKLLGTFFLPSRVLKHADDFNKAFKNKVLLYLFEDVAKSRRDALFVDGSRKTFANLQSDFDSLGHKIFNELPVVDEIHELSEKASPTQEPVEDSASENNQGS